MLGISTDSRTSEIANPSKAITLEANLLLMQGIIKLRITKLSAYAPLMRMRFRLGFRPIESVITVWLK